MALTDAQIQAQRAFSQAAFGTSSNASAVAERLRARAERMGDLQRALQALATEFQAETDRAFELRRSPAGEAWRPLAQSTIDKRTRKTGRPTLLRSRRSGRFTSAATLQPLEETGALRRSIVYKAQGNGISVRPVEYLKPHQSGGRGEHPPKRNPLVIERVGGKSVLYPDADRRFREVINRFVIDGVLP